MACLNILCFFTEIIYLKYIIQSICLQSVIVVVFVGGQKKVDKKTNRVLCFSKKLLPLCPVSDEG